MKFYQRIIHIKSIYDSFFIEKNILFIPRVVVRLELEAPFVRPENLSAFVLVFFFLPFQLRVLCYSRAVFVQLHSPIFNENVG